MRNIQIQKLVSVASRGVSVDVDTTKLSDELIAELVVHGLVQKVSDAASQAKAIADKSDDSVEAITEQLMLKARDALYAGDWTRRGAGAGIDDATRVARQIVRASFKAQVGGKSPQWAQFTGLSDADQAAKLDSWFEANKTTFEPAVKAELKRLKDARDAKAGLAKATVFSF